jgi:RNA polymerase sigma factor (sigma-70 family)
VVALDTRMGDELAAPESDVLKLDEALEELAKVDGRAAQIVEMRFYGGMTEPEIAETLGLSDRTVRRSWEKARLLLASALK